jgi:hypothetical protein
MSHMIPLSFLPVHSSSSLYPQYSGNLFSDFGPSSFSIESQLAGLTTASEPLYVSHLFAIPSLTLVIAALSNVIIDRFLSVVYTWSVEILRPSPLGLTYRKLHPER